ncbi:MAG TPA: DUF1016 N-terminal domain-containing protein [Blastocatellia bacterium]|nr:DUF1016 N-terminal domain-containing protein [Blastocatellia bacterium]
MPKTKQHKIAITKTSNALTGYEKILAEITGLLESARRAAARTVNLVMTATYWEVGRRIVEFEQRGPRRAGYGEELLGRLSADLTVQFGRSLSRQNLQQMRQFYTIYPPEKICQTVSGKLRIEPGEPALWTSNLNALAEVFCLPWSHYVRLAVKNPLSRAFYEREAISGGWSVRQFLVQNVVVHSHVKPILSRRPEFQISQVRDGAIWNAHILLADILTKREHQQILLLYRLASVPPHNLSQFAQIEE